MLPRFLLPSDSILEQMWQRLPLDAPIRERALFFAMGTHERLGCASPLSKLADLPEMVRAILWTRASTPIVVPDDYPTLAEAALAANDMQTIFIRAGQHTLTGTTGMPTKIDKELHIFGLQGAVLVGGLHLGMDSCGTIKNLEIRGHLWVYGKRPVVTGHFSQGRRKDSVRWCALRRRSGQPNANLHLPYEAHTSAKHANSLCDDSGSLNHHAVSLQTDSGRSPAAKFLTATRTLPLL